MLCWQVVLSEPFSLLLRTVESEREWVFGGLCAAGPLLGVALTCAQAGSLLFQRVLRLLSQICDTIRPTAELQFVASGLHQLLCALAALCNSASVHVP